MRKFRIGFMCFLATLLVAFVAGCGQETVTLPSVVSVTPAQGSANVAIGTTITATFSQAMSSATITTSTFTVAAQGGAAVTGTVAYSGLVATFTPSAALAYGTTYTATITTGAATPGGAELIGPYVWSFTTGAASVPAVLSVTPLAFAANVPITGAGATISATFTQAMTAASIAATGTFTVEAQGGVAVPGSAVLNSAGTVATFTPTSGTLAYSTTYTVTITTAAKSLSQGIPLAGNYVWTFTTAAAPLPAAPTVTATYPANAATGIALNPVVTASFSESMDPNTIIGANFTLTIQGSGTLVSGSVSYVGPGNKLEFQLSPNVFLQPSTTYTATISNLVTNVYGTALNGGVVPTVCATSTGGNCVWNFTTTATGTNNTQPMLVSTYPANGAQNVCQNPAVSATFSEAMNQQTFTSKTFYITDSTGTLVAGSYSYDATNFIETFTPTSTLAPGTYTARVTDGATDMFGIGLLVNATGPPPNPWTFTTNSSTCSSAPALGVLAPFGGFGGGAGMTNMGISTVINNGNIGTTGASTLITGFHDTSLAIVGAVWPCTYTETTSNIGQVNGVIDTGLPPPTVNCPLEGTNATLAIATAALAQANVTYLSLQSNSAPGPGIGNATPGTTLANTELGGTTLYPGVYYSASTVKITSGDLTLDAQGDPTATFVFQVGSALTVGLAAIPRNIILAHGANASNIYWVCGSSATINGSGGGTFNGTVIAYAGISVGTNGASPVTTINGRLIGMGASTTLANTIINVPAH
jgi:methionine-rich copper-binding protein CopC